MMKDEFGNEYEPEFDKQVRLKSEKKLEEYFKKKKEDEKLSTERLVKFNKELDEKFDKVDAGIMESILRIKDYTGWYFVPSFLIGIYIGWRLGFVICNAMMKAYYP